ncbi:MAG: RNase adapter RapZ [Immundisolibacter sp.]
MQRLVIISGLSGAGKSTALRALEDIGFYCVDNLPIALLPALSEELTRTLGQSGVSAAVGIDARNVSDLAAFPDILHTLRAHRIDCQVLFLTADRQTLINRYNETRRQHPLAGAGGSISDAIDTEQQRLAPIAELAALSIDSSGLNIYQLRSTVRDLYSQGPQTPTLVFQSFGYKFGTPLDADMVFDMRCLPNPHWDPALRECTGLDETVRAFLEQQPDVQQLYEDIRRFLHAWLPRFAASDRSQVTIGIGCTGGRHRSVYMAHRLGEHFRNQPDTARHGRVLVRHRQLGR